MRSYLDEYFGQDEAHEIGRGIDAYMAVSDDVSFLNLWDDSDFNLFSDSERNSDDMEIN